MTANKSGRVMNRIWGVQSKDLAGSKGGGGPSIATEIPAMDDAGGGN